MILLNKTFRKIILIIFTVIAVLWGYILLKAFIFNISYINLGHTRIGIIGDAGWPTFLFISGRTFPLLLWLISIITFTILNIISIYKKSKSKILNIFVVIFFIVLICGIFLTPPQSYSISLYATFRWFIVNNTHWVVWGFYSISLVITVLTGFLLLPLKSKKGGVR